MQEAKQEDGDASFDGPRDEKQDYVPLMLSAMVERNVGLRALSLRTGIGKSRLGLLLHRDPAKRSNMNLIEFQQILRALDIDFVEAVLTVEAVSDPVVSGTPRYRSLLAMLCTMVRGLPARVIAELDAVEGVDGTEVRPEWAPVLQRAVAKRLVYEIAAVARRRAQLSDFSID